MADASTTIADVIVPKGNFGGGQQRGYSNNTDAASELYSGPKSKKCPIHDSMAGYDGTPRPSDNIMARAKRRGYLTAAS